MEGMSRLMTECWSASPLARLTSLRVMKTLKKLVESAEASVKV